jgi:hypothetical protein
MHLVVILFHCMTVAMMMDPKMIPMATLADKMETALMEMMDLATVEIDDGDGYYDSGGIGGNDGHGDDSGNNRDDGNRQNDPSWDNYCHGGFAHPQPRGEPGPQMAVLPM